MTKLQNRLRTVAVLSVLFLLWVAVACSNALEEPEGIDVDKDENNAIINEMDNELSYENEQQGNVKDDGQDHNVSENGNHSIVEGDLENQNETSEPSRPEDIEKTEHNKTIDSNDENLEPEAPVANENETDPEPEAPVDHRNHSSDGSNNDQKDIDNENSTSEAPLPEEQPRVLKIGMLNLQEEDKSNFRRDFTQMFEWEYPNVEIDFVTAFSERFSISNPPKIDSLKEMEQLMISANPPDVLFLNYGDYRALMEKGLLVALDPFLKESEVSLDDFEPIVVDGLANPQDDLTYGLVPYFTANALIYNKDLFDQVGMEYPSDRMTWDEVFTLAKQMTFADGDKNVYGLMFEAHNYRPPNMDELWRRYIIGTNKQMIDETSGQLKLNHEEWHDIFIDIKDLYDSGVFPRDESEGQIYRVRNKFLSGTIAMAIAEYSIIQEIYDTTISAQNGQRDEVPNWDIVSIPVHSDSPNVGAGVKMEPVIAINANGSNQQDAWRLIEMIHSAEWARHSDENTMYRLSSRKDAVNLKDVDYNKTALYQLRAPEYVWNDPSSRFGINAYNYRIISHFGDHYLGQVLEGKMAISEALEMWEFEWNSLLQFEQSEN